MMATRTAPMASYKAATPFDFNAGAPNASTSAGPIPAATEKAKMRSLHSQLAVIDAGMKVTKAHIARLYRKQLAQAGGYPSLSKSQADTSEKTTLTGIFGNRDPSGTLPAIIQYLKQMDMNSANFRINLAGINEYIQKADKERRTGHAAFQNARVAKQLDEALLLTRIHQYFEQHYPVSRFTTVPAPRTSSRIIRGPLRSQRLLPYPVAFPKPLPDRGRNGFRRFEAYSGTATKLFNNTSLLLNVAPLQVNTGAGTRSELSPMFREYDQYVQSERSFFHHERNNLTPANKQRPFQIENTAFEIFLQVGPKNLAGQPAPEYTLSSTTPKPNQFYVRRGWQRAALMACLNQLSNDENRVVNTRWTRPIMPAIQPQEQKDLVFYPRVRDPASVSDVDKDPCPWFHYANQYMQLVDHLAAWERRRYNRENWNNFCRSALPINFRGPRVYQGHSVYDDNWLKIGEHLDGLLSLLMDTYGAAPRQFLRAILRDIDAGKRGDVHMPDYNRRSIARRRAGNDTLDENSGEAGVDPVFNSKLVDEHDIAWLRYLCEPSRTVSSMDPAHQLTDNLLQLFDSKLQEFFWDFTASGSPGREIVDKFLWDDSASMRMQAIYDEWEPPDIYTALAYINGCHRTQVSVYTKPQPNPLHPNKCYQFSAEEAEVLCIMLQQRGRCVYIGPTDSKPPRVGRPSYTLNPEDRVCWRYPDENEFHDTRRGYMNAMLDFYDGAYPSPGQRQLTTPDRSNELVGLLDHAGPTVAKEMALLETIVTTEPRQRQADRREFIKHHLVSERRFAVGDAPQRAIEEARHSPYWEDLLDWRTVYFADVERLGLKNSRARQLRQDVNNQAAGWTVKQHLLKQSIPELKTPERTVQFFRNLAYRMGCTMRHIELIRQRLSYDEPLPPNHQLPEQLDMDVGLKDPRPASTIPGPRMAVDATSQVISCRQWQTVSEQDYNREVQHWRETIDRGMGEVPFLPPNIQEVLDRADPRGYFRGRINDQDPWDIMRKGIINDLVENRVVLYPGRPTAFRDLTNQAYQGVERPNLFAWATKEQRRFQARHTRKTYFSLRRWPVEHQPAAVQEAIRHRKDEVIRIDPSQPGQEHGILTYRLPTPDTRTGHAHPLGKEWHHPLEGTMRGRMLPTPSNSPEPPTVAPTAATTAAAPTAAVPTGTIRRNQNPISRRNNVFIPGPAVFPAGETLLQQISISKQLEQALYPQPAWYKRNPRYWWDRYTATAPPQIPLLPEIARANIPRSNPRKRRIPAEFQKTFDPKRPANWRQIRRQRRHSHSSSDSDDSGTPDPRGHSCVAKTKYREMFPNDKGHVELPQNGNRYSSVRSAIITSIARQHPEVKVPSPAEFDEALDQEATNLKWKRLDSNRCNFVFEMISVMMHVWAQTQDDKPRLQLGLVVGPENKAFLVDGPAIFDVEEDDAIMVVWIKSNLEVVLGQKPRDIFDTLHPDAMTKADRDGDANHFSALDMQP
ncbi:hypothetical protein F5Y15DRAFT_315721 [Xylariaceae sp. FL0016]|nr:hypothetical protein F5Y15DRAFT_315721 [Xylariaceae sp. FL0016]